LIRARRSASPHRGHGISSRFCAKIRLKTAQNGQAPIRRASVSAVFHQIAICCPTPTANAAPWLPTSSMSPARVPSFSGVASSPATSAHVWLERCFPLPEPLGKSRGRSALAALALAVGVVDADTCGRRFLLDLSGGLKSGSACGAAIDSLPSPGSILLMANSTTDKFLPSC
jgi:hypothetical protein